ncbi:protein NDUFAF4 homolog isoform X2 [Bradysia coprophila]|uniref:protein NDUFAF4 homolog isoform X2 n=1 Tax=Bradysia coprophila TaxID=38358 RepID=UPI00187D8CAC|nr:protein NDUFAF4 homolog isoform X2 [Bradysia coprophila]
MGKVLSVATRKARRFNADNRAHRFLDKEKLEAAPKFESNIRDYQRVLEEKPDFAQLESKKNSVLDERLKQVYVTSTDPVVASSSDDQTNKPLPLDRKAVQDFEFGYLEPEQAMRGRVTLRQALTFISKHSAEPETWTIEKISDEYKLKPSVVGSILKHFQTFEVYIPENKEEDKVLTKDRLKQLWHNEPKPLPPPEYGADEMFDRLRKEHDENQQKKDQEKKEQKERSWNQRKLE